MTGEAGTEAGRGAGHRTPAWQALILLAAIAAAAIGTGPVEARFGFLAQASPTTIEEVACAVPPGPDAPTSDGTAGTDLLASPTTTPSPEEVRAALAAELEALSRTLARCLSEGDSETVALLVTEAYLGQAYGGGGRLTRDEYLALADALPVLPTAVRAFADVGSESAGHATADVVYVVANQLRHGRWSFVRGTDGRTAGRWLVDAEEALPVEAPADAAVVDVELEDGAFELDPSRASGPAVVLEGRNTGERDHEMLVLRLDDDVTTDALLREPGPALPEGITFVGQVTVPVDEEATLTLVDLEPGIYTLVCLLPDPTGVPDLALGMEANLRVQ